MRSTPSNRFFWLCLLAALCVVWKIAASLEAQTSRPGLEKQGGTVLIYEVHDPAHDKAHWDRESALLVEALRNRLDPSGGHGITVTSTAAGRIEIAIPRSAGHDQRVRETKELLRQQGLLEFRILANGVDDSAAIADATSLINFNSPEVQAKLREAQDKGLPPPAPHQLGNGLQGELKRYTLNLARNNKSEVTYGWVELGTQERYTLGLDNAARKDPRRSDNWSVMDRERGRALQIVSPNSVDRRPLLQGALFYSRECKDRNIPEEQRRQKQYEYFVLIRNPEIDPATGQETPKIDGSYLANALVDTTNPQPAVAFTFNSKGGELFGTLTGKNVPSGTGADESQMKRHLAIILDGLVVSAPTINSQIRERGQITGNFTRLEVDRLVTILRSGALPARLRPEPVREMHIVPKK
jgi:SecD/SecF fusion protein